MIKQNLILVIMLLFFSLNSCSTFESVESLEKISAPIEIKILKYKFIPQTIEIKAGQTIQWVNLEKRQYHSVWFEQQGEEESDYMFPGDTLKKQFTKPGRYPYRCGPHPEMVGVIIVN